MKEQKKSNYNLHQKCKRILSGIMEWKKDKVWAWIFKILCLLSVTGILALLLFMTYKHILPFVSTVFVLLILLLLYYSEYIVAWLTDIRNESRQTGVPVSALSEQTIAEVLFESLVDSAALLDIVPPKTISDICPVRYSPYQMDGQILYTRFIIRYQKERTDFTDMSRVLNDELIRKLLYRIACPVGRIIIFRMGKDIVHAGAYYMDVLYVDDECKYAYVQQLEYQRRLLEEKDGMPDIEDKEF